MACHVKEISHLKLKCLIVDELQENRLALQSLLHDEHVEVIHARSVLEALDTLLQHDFALALIDVQMPGMDGFELAEIMRSTDRTRGIPLIFVTAAGNEAQRIFQGYEKGAVDFLQQPLSGQIVISKVKVFLELHTQRMLLEQKLQKIKETESYLQKALKTRDEFLSICSHELKTPLTSLKMQIQITNRLKEKKGAEVAFSEENMDKFLLQADRSVERIIHLVNDMLDISRVASGRLSLNLEKIDLGKLTADVIERLQSFMEIVNSPVKTEIKSDVTGLWDRFRLEQVLTNLLTNAAKYAPESEVDVHVYKLEGMGILKVTDHGKGISEEDQKRIFERFERAVSSHSVSGLGLGLYISREIIKLHHGIISVESVLGQGTTFTVRLPLI